VERTLRVIEQLRLGQDVSADVIAEVISGPDALPVQAGALFCLLDSRTGAADKLPVDELVKRWPELVPLLSHHQTPSDQRGSSSSFLADRLKKRKPVGVEIWKTFLADLTSERCKPSEAAFILMLVTLHGLRDSDAVSLATGLRDSGSIFDYRALVRPRRLLRRYPTGAVSEKAALVLPAVLSALAASYPIASNFLVAPTLGFTGGTWDKLTAIKGFTFPEPGADTERILLSRHVAMCVTSAQVAPADKALYQIRSLTGTIESNPLIAASVASKQGSLPCDYLLLDVRYGPGAFLTSRAASESVASLIQEILTGWSIPNGALWTDTDWPGGISVGNSVEVAEAIAVLSPPSQGPWQRDLLETQWQLVIRFLRGLMEPAFGSAIAERAMGQAVRLRAEGVLVEAFRRLLKSHGVEDQYASQLVADPMKTFFGQTPPIEVLTANAGIVERIDQRRLGRIVNMALGAGGNEYGGRRNPRAGIILRIRRGEMVQKGQVLMDVFGYNDDELPRDVLFELSECVGFRQT
jgi:pyrimidine-nucleoside phosphorylase